MARKLKVQLEVDSSKARSTVARDMSGIDIGGTSRVMGPRSSGAAADRLAKSLDNAAKKTGEFAGSAEVMSAKARQVVGAFTGMGVSMAMSFASQNMKKGGARDAVEVGAGTLQGAAMGGMAGGPWGALIGGAAGLGMGLWNKSQERKRYTEDWGKSEHDYASDKAFQNLVKSLTDVSDKTVDFGAKIKVVEEELEKYKQVEEKLKANVESFIKAGRYDDADAQRGYLAENRQRQEQLEAAKKQLEGADKKDDEKTIEALGPGGGTDALQKVGGMRGVFTGGALGLEMGVRNKSQERKRNTEGLEQSEHDFANDKAFSDLLKSLTDVSDKTDDFAAKIKSVEEELEKYKQVEEKLKQNVEGMIKSGRYNDADAQRNYLAKNQSRQEQLESAKKQLESTAKKDDEKTIDALGLGGGTDSLQKDGGMRGAFAAEKMDNLESDFRSAVQSANRNLEKLEEDGNKVLREIAANTRKQGGSKWQ